MFELEQFRAWVEAQPGEIVGVSRASRLGLYAYRDNSPVAKWVSELLGQKVTLIRGRVGDQPLMRPMGVKLPQWAWQLDHQCNRRPAQPVGKAELLSWIDALVHPAMPTPPRRRWW